MSRVVLFGDVGVDCYHIGTVRGLSAEAPIPVVDETRERCLPAMGANVAANLLALGVEVNGPIWPARVPIKNRLMTEDGMQLARWDENDHCAPLDLEEIERWFTNYEPDLALVADYRKGAITYEAIARITTLGRELDIPLFIDTKGNPADYLHDGIEGTLFFPNMSEFEKYRREYLYLPNVLLKQGAAGMTLLKYGEPVLHSPSYALSGDVRCVNGAGDTVLAGFASAYLSGWDGHDCVAYASACAAAVVSQPFDKRTTSNQDALTIWKRHSSPVSC